MVKAPAHVRNSVALAGALALVLTILAAPRAEAVLLKYKFSGIAAAGSAVQPDLTSSTTFDLTGVPFTVTGSTISDVDHGLPGDGNGLFFATSTYDFGFGSFVTDAGGDVYLQCGDATEDYVACAGLADEAIENAMVAFHAPVAGDPDFAIPLGTVQVIPFAIGNPRLFFNSANQGLRLSWAFTDPTFITVTAVPEPSSLALFGLALAGLGLSRRRAKAPARSDS